MAGIEGGVSTGAAVETAPGMGGFHGAEIGSATGIVAQATSVAEQAWNASAVSSPLDGVEAAMHDAARNAWAATEPMSIEPTVGVFSPEVTAFLAFTGWQAQLGLSQQTENLVQTSPESKPVLHTMPLEVSSFSPSALTPEIAMLEEVPLSTAVAQKEVQSINESSDAIVAENIVSLAQSLGIAMSVETQSLVDEALATSGELAVPSENSAAPVMETITTAQGESAVGELTEAESIAMMRADQEVLSEEELDMAPQTQKKTSQGKSEPKDTDIGFEEDVYADEERRRVARESYTAAMQREGEVPDEVLAQRVVNGFFTGVEGNAKAISQIAQGGEDGTLTVHIRGKVVEAPLHTPDEAKRAIDHAIGDTPAVKVGDPRLPEEAARKVFDRGIRRTVVLSPLAA